MFRADTVTDDLQRIEARATGSMNPNADIPDDLRQLSATKKVYFICRLTEEVGIREDYVTEEIVPTTWDAVVSQLFTDAIYSALNSLEDESIEPDERYTEDLGTISFNPEQLTDGMIAEAEGRYADIEDYGKHSNDTNEVISDTISNYRELLWNDFSIVEQTYLLQETGLEHHIYDVQETGQFPDATLGNWENTIETGILWHHLFAVIDQEAKFKKVTDGAT